MTTEVLNENIIAVLTSVLIMASAAISVRYAVRACSTLVKSHDRSEAGMPFAIATFASLVVLMFPIPAAVTRSMSRDLYAAVDVLPYLGASLVSVSVAIAAIMVFPLMAGFIYAFAHDIYSAYVPSWARTRNVVSGIKALHGVKNTEKRITDVLRPLHGGTDEFCNRVVSMSFIDKVQTWWLVSRDDAVSVELELETIRSLPYVKSAEVTHEDGGTRVGVVWDVAGNREWTSAFPSDDVWDAVPQSKRYPFGMADVPERAPCSTQVTSS